MARQQAPGTEATGLRALFRLEDQVDYWDGEVEPGEDRERPADRRGRRRDDGRRHRPGRLPGRLRDPAARPGAGGAGRRRGAPAGRARARAPSGGAGAARRRSRLPVVCRSAPQLDDLAGCELIIEAAPEDLELKQELFAQLARCLRPGDGPRHQHLLALGRRDRRRRSGTAAGRGHALLQPAGADEAGRGRGRAGVLRGGAAAGDRGRRADGPHAGSRRRRDRLPRQPLRAPLQPRGAAASRRPDRRRGDDRPHLPGRRRLSHGPVRAHRPGRRRRQLRGREVLLGAELSRAALAAAPDPAADGLRRAAGPKVRARLLRLLEGAISTGGP